MYTLQSPVRSQLYKAACFYLSVTGKLPKVKRIWIASKNETIDLDKNRLTRHWENCAIGLPLDPETAAACFCEQGKVCYIAMTYFLKAQLDIFPLDSFRAAWSGLNALYTQLRPEEEHEYKKLNLLDNLMRGQKLSKAEKYVKQLPEDFWAHIRWWMFLEKNYRDRDRMIETIKNNGFADPIVYKYLSNSYIRILKQENKEAAERFAAQAKYKLVTKQENTKQQLIFLVKEYCYLIRNHSFHAADPYPVFSLYDENHKSEEEYLVELLLILISELMPVICKKQ